MTVETPAALLERLESKARDKDIRVIHVGPKECHACGYSSDGDLRGAQNIVEQHQAEVTE